MAEREARSRSADSSLAMMSFFFCGRFAIVHRGVYKEWRWQSRIVWEVGRDVPCTHVGACLGLWVAVRDLSVAVGDGGVLPDLGRYARQVFLVCVRFSLLCACVCVCVVCVALCFLVCIARVCVCVRACAERASVFGACVGERHSFFHVFRN